MNSAVDEKARDTPSGHLKPDVVASDSDLDVESTVVNEKALIRKIDLVLLPGTPLGDISRVRTNPMHRSSYIVSDVFPGPQQRCKCTCRRPCHRCSHDWQPISDRIDPFLLRLCHLRDTMQHHPKAYYTQILAADFDNSLRNCGDLPWYCTESRGILCCEIHLGSSRIWSLSWCCVVSTPARAV